MALLQGFEEINMSVPTGKAVMTVTESVARFNKAAAADLGYPAYVKILINDKTRQIAVQACNAKSANAVKFSKPEGKQTASVNIKEAVVLEALHKYFELPQASEGEVAYKSVAGTIHVEPVPPYSSAKRWDIPTSIGYFYTYVLYRTHDTTP